MGAGLAWRTREATVFAHTSFGHSCIVSIVESSQETGNELLVEVHQISTSAPILIGPLLPQFAGSTTPTDKGLVGLHFRQPPSLYPTLCDLIPVPVH